MLKGNFEKTSRLHNNSKKLISAAVLILCIYNVDDDWLQNLSRSDADLILQLLTLKPDCEKRCCSDYDALTELLPKQVR